MKSSTWWMTTVVLLACGPGVGQGHREGVATGATARLRVDHESVLTFQRDWSVLPTNLPIMAGGRLRIEYDTARLPSCRATSGGVEAWRVIPFYRFAPDTAVRQGVLTPAGITHRVVLEVPEDATEVELWFQSSDAQGCGETDDRFGQNYRYPVARPARSTDVVFGADWTQVAQGVVAGGLMRLVYAPERLRACRATYAGGRAWNIVASWIFRPGGQTGDVALYEGSFYDGEHAILTPTVYVPEDATGVDLWFSNTDRAGCRAWDSNFGDNYRFEVTPPSQATPPVGWAGEFNFVSFHRPPQTNLGDVDPAYYWDATSGSEVATWVEVQVWVAGVTDQRYPSEEAARAAAESRIRAEAVTDALSGTAPNGWGTMALTYRRQQGNNFVFSFDFNRLRWGSSGIADGLYRYYLRFATDEGATWYEVGRDGNTSRRFVVAPALTCGLFPDHPPAGCPRDRAVGWAGSWGGRFTHACDHASGLPDPAVFTKSSGGHDCMVITAEVWVPGLTDQSGDPREVVAQVETDIGFQGGPLSALTTYPLTFDGRVGNNYRFAWNLAEHVGRADRGDYRFRFRFSGDGGNTWFAIGTGDGPAGGELRRLLVRNDSQDLPVVRECGGIYRWDGPTSALPSCVDYSVDQNHDASFCELYANALGKGSLSHNGSWARWLEAYLRVAEQQGQMQSAGMLARIRQAGGTIEDRFYLGTQIEPGYWMTGVTLARGGPGGEAFELDLVDFAFFIDVRRPTGEVVRLWQSGGGANYTVAGAFPDDPRFVPYTHSIGIGSIDYAHEGVPLFEERRTCQ